MAPAKVTQTSVTTPQQFLLSITPLVRTHRRLGCDRIVIDQVDMKNDLATKLPGRYSESPTQVD